MVKKKTVHQAYCLYQIGIQPGRKVYLLLPPKTQVAACAIGRSWKAAGASLEYVMAGLLRSRRLTLASVLCLSLRDDVSLCAKFLR